MVFPAYSSSPFTPGFEMGNMMAFASPEMLVANNANRKKLIEQRSNKNMEEEGPNFLQKFFNYLSSKDQQKFDASGKVIPTSTFQATPVSEYLGVTNIDDSISKPSLGKDIQSIFTPSYYKTEEQIEYDLTRGNNTDKVEKVKKKLGIEDPKERDYLDENKQLLGEIATLAEQARDRAALRTGISNLALSPLLGGQASMDAAANISKLTGVNMAAIASQGNVMAGNPTKQKIAGKYFRL